MKSILKMAYEAAIEKGEEAAETAKFLKGILEAADDLEFQGLKPSQIDMGFRSLACIITDICVRTNEEICIYAQGDRP